MTNGSNILHIIERRRRLRPRRGVRSLTAIVHFGFCRSFNLIEVFGAALQAGRSPAELILLVTGRISGELAFKAARAGVAAIATPSVPSTIAVDISRAAGMLVIARAVSGAPQVHRPDEAR